MDASLQIRGITICVQYDDLLAITLPRNAVHMAEVVVVTHPSDVRTKRIVEEVPNAILYETDAFYRYGAKFNKGLAMEEGFDVLGREGWLLVWDADTLFPPTLNLPVLKPGKLYTPYRRILNDPTQWFDGFDWKQASQHRDKEWCGYFQLFHASDAVLRQRPWYGVNFTHCGGCDSVFQRRWHQCNKIRPPFEVLHLGPRDTNWFGRASTRRDGETIEEAQDRHQLMDTFMRYKRWRRRGPRVTDFQEHVPLPPDERERLG